MPNHLAIPAKRAHPTAFPAGPPRDLADWAELRAAALAAHADAAPVLVYHAQLQAVRAKLPDDPGLVFAYAPAFAPAAPPDARPSIAYERAATLFNLAALLARHAAAEDRAAPNGLARATASYQHAAGTFALLRTAAVPKLADCPPDLAPPVLRSLESLLLAQAQECAWQRAVADQYKNSLIAKLAAGVASLYKSALDALRAAAPDARDQLPSTWMPHLDTKERHFRAAAQYRKSMDDLEANHYGDELRRLIDAEAEASQAYSAAKRAALSPAVVQDIKSLLDVLQKNRTRAERDNDLIYHKDVPPSSAIAPIQEVIMVQSILLPALADPKTALTGRILFADLLSWGAREAVNIYNDNKQALIKERITDFAQELDDDADSTLRSLNLPSSLEALERPIGLPPSLLKKAEQVRSDQGPERIETSLDDVELLARRAMEILDEAMDVLDTEASEDEAARKDVTIQRLPSHEANRDLVQKQERYRSILTEAANSDAVVRKKWVQWEKPIVQLALDEDELERLVPSSTISVSGPTHVAGSPTQVHARALRGLLESLDDVRHTRDDLVSRARRRGDVDDIRPRIMAAAEKLDQDADITPAMFTDVSDEELAKYDRFIQGLVEGQKKQENLLDAIKSTNDKFISSRKVDTSVKERQQALQNLDAAYEKYREITRNLEEGHKFYNDMSNLLMRFKEACKMWSNARSQEAQSFYRQFSAMRIQESKEANAPSASAETPRRPKWVANLPSLSSAEWQAEELPPPPPGSKRG